MIVRAKNIKGTSPNSRNSNSQVSFVGGDGKGEGIENSKGVLTAERVEGKLARSFQEHLAMNLSTFEQVQLMLSAGQRESLEKVQAALEENPQCLEKVAEEKEDA